MRISHVLSCMAPRHVSSTSLPQTRVRAWAPAGPTQDDVIFVLAETIFEVVVKPEEVGLRGMCYEVGLRPYVRRKRWQSGLWVAGNGRSRTQSQRYSPAVTV